MTWRERRWVAKFRTVDGDWSTKRLPAHLTASKEGAARAWAIDWYERYLASGGVRPDSSEVEPSRRVTLSDIFDRWSAYRKNDPGTDPGYARALVSQYKNAIAGHPVARLDIGTELQPLQIVTWMRQLSGAASTKMTVTSTLSVMLSDAILHGASWGIEPSQPHPMLSSPHVIRELDGLRRGRTAERVTPVFDPTQIEAIFATRTSKVLDARRVKYVLALHTGMREREVQGLTWGDVKDLPTPHVWVSRQLVHPGAAPFLWLADVRREHGSDVDLGSIPNAVCKPPKRNSRRAIPLRPLMGSVLAWWRATGWQQFTGRAPTDADPIFPSGLRNSHQAYGQFCAPVAGAMLLVDLERLGLSGSYTSPQSGLVAAHSSRSFRHTFASLLSQVGIDDGRIGDLLGHSSGSVTRTHYIETLLASRAEVVSKLPLPARVVLSTTEILDPSQPAPKAGKVLSFGSADPRSRR